MNAKWPPQLLRIWINRPRRMQTDRIQSGRDVYAAASCLFTLFKFDRNVHGNRTKKKKMGKLYNRTSFQLCTLFRLPPTAFGACTTKREKTWYHSFCCCCSISDTFKCWKWWYKWWETVCECVDVEQLVHFRNDVPWITRNYANHFNIFQYPFDNGCDHGLANIYAN